MSTIKIRARENKGSVTVKALIKHPMETGQRKNKKTGDLIPSHYIQEVKANANGKDVITVYWGPAVSKNPYITFDFNLPLQGSPFRKNCDSLDNYNDISFKTMMEDIVHYRTPAKLRDKLILGIKTEDD